MIRGQAPLRRLVVAALAVAALCSPLASARAADPVAEAIFQEGLAQLRAERFEEACRLLAASQEREPKSGTLVVLASCHAQLGRTATAWAEYKEAAALARAEGREAHADKANELAAELAPRLSTVRIDVGVPRPSGLTVTMDETTLPDGGYALAVPVDPGEHVVAASAPGRRPWRRPFSLASGERLVLAIPDLEPAPPVDVAPAKPPRTSPPPSSAAPGEPGARWPWIVGGAGLVALGASAVALAVSASGGAELDDECSEKRDLCPLDYDEGPARTAELAGFGFFVGFGVAGVVGVVTGATALLTQPSAAPVARVSASREQARLQVAVPF